MKKNSLLAGLCIITIWLSACGNKSYDMSFQDAVKSVDKNNSQINELIQNTEYFEEKLWLSTSVTTWDTKINLQISFDSKKNTQNAQSDSNIFLNTNISSAWENIIANWSLQAKLLPDALYLNLINLELTWNDIFTSIPTLAEWLKSQRFSVPLSWIEFMSWFMSYAQNIQTSELNAEHLYINEWLTIYTWKYNKYNWYNAWKFSIDSEKLLWFVNEYMNSLYSNIPDYEVSSGLNLKSSINNFEWYLVIVGKNSVVTIIENMDITIEDITMNTTCINSSDELILNINSQWDNIINLSAIKQWKKYNVSLDLANILNIYGTITPNLTESNINLLFDLSIDINSANQQIWTFSIPFQGERNFSQISEFNIEAPAESIALSDLLWSYLWAGILDDYEAEDYSEDENYEVASYQDVESLEDYLVE